MSGQSAATKVGHVLAKGLGIKLNYREGYGEEKITRGESVFSVASADTYVEQEPTSAEYLLDLVPTGKEAAHFIIAMFPFLSWIGHYNLTWFIGDLIAGVTIGAVVVPQSMAYAGLAQLSPEFGLYSAFMGVLIYWFFATSKDITIGPVAVMSTIVGNVVIESQKTIPDVEGYVIASAMAIIAGSIVFFLGFIRFGFLVEFISLASVCAFITGSSFNIAMGQVPNLLGINKLSNVVNSRGPTYLVVIDTLKNLKHCRLDAAIGLTALLMLYLIRYACTVGGKRYPSKARLFFFASTLRTIFVILLYTLISWLVNRNVPGIHVKANLKKAPHFGILGTVPRGFQHAGAPTVNLEIIRSFTSQIPVSVIVLLIEHISISKSFGRINNYTINPSQELLAIGVTNLLGPFLGAYPATGSFSRTAIKSKAGVRTPLAGVITAVVVLIAIYGLTAVFFYIPNAALSAVIIHAVLDLITPANTLYQFWRISPLEVIIFLVGVFVTVFDSIEDGIYSTIGISAGVLLFRVVKAQGRLLGRVTVHSVVGDHLIQSPDKNAKGELELKRADETSGRGAGDHDISVRNVFLPLDHQDGSNPQLQVTAPYPGVFIYRFSEGYNYPNASHYTDYLVQTIFKETRRTNLSTYGKLGDRPWNDPGPRKGKPAIVDDHKPTLKAVILDFSSVNNVDITSVQTLIDVRNQLDRYAAPNVVEWHITSINNRWTKRALSSAGFGYPTAQNETGDFQRWKPIFSVAEIGGADSAAAEAQARENRRAATRQNDEEGGIRSASVNQTALEKELSQAKAYNSSGSKRVAVVQGINRPFFHIDLTSALESVISTIERQEAHAPSEAHLPRKGYGTVGEEEQSNSGSSK
ncbi:hypothetical protein FH972_026296 [Carpinus fangiana]|uniref:STAS domain-containing protein n=1 Tax=Carpinus fangiana TaxID=176857 RepID=A0A5N6L3X6_9ROSI|nr:hypothetical protein FH972_026296 [Carpinus fangiana]